MRAVRLDAPGAPLRLVDVPTPEPSGTEVRIRVAGCGVCHTDLHIVDGTQPRVDFPLILGHEVAGWVDALGRRCRWSAASADAVSSTAAGAAAPVASASRGAEQRCPNGRSPGFQADGGYAEFMLVPHPRHLVALGCAGSRPGRAAGRRRPDLLPCRAARGSVAEARRAGARHRCRRARPVRAPVPAAAARRRSRARGRGNRTVEPRARACDGAGRGSDAARSGGRDAPFRHGRAGRRGPRLRRQRRDTRARGRGRRARTAS